MKIICIVWRLFKSIVNPSTSTHTQINWQLQQYNMLYTKLHKITLYVLLCCIYTYIPTSTYTHTHLTAGRKTSFTICMYSSQQLWLNARCSARAALLIHRRSAQRKVVAIGRIGRQWYSRNHSFSLHGCNSKSTHRVPQTLHIPLIKSTIDTSANLFAITLWINYNFASTEEQPFHIYGLKWLPIIKLKFSFFLWCNSVLWVRGFWK